MNAKIVIPAAVLGMLLLIAGGFALDSVRLARHAQERVLLVDGELRQQEEKLVSLLTNHPQETSEVKIAVAAFERAREPQLRHAAYDQMVAQVRNTMLKNIDPTNPLGRRFMDEVAGVLNRRELITPRYEREAAAYREVLDSLSGRVARKFVPGLEPNLTSRDMLAEDPNQSAPPAR